METQARCHVKAVGERVKSDCGEGLPGGGLAGGGWRWAVWVMGSKEYRGCVGWKEQGSWAGGDR